MPPARLTLWLLSLASLGFAARAFLVAPPPAWVTLSLLLVLAALATVGVLFPNLQVYGDVLTRLPAGMGQVALTFDDGPHPETTRRVLRLLSERGAKATFFVVGRKAERYPDVVREIVAGGHALGLHGYQHDRLYSFRSPRYVLEDILRTQDAIEAACGVRPVLFRPPIGFVSHLTSIAAERAGVSIVGWSVRALDGYGGATPRGVLSRVERGLGDGAIVLLHDASEREAFVPASLEILPDILQRLEDARLTAVSAEALATPPQPSPADRGRNLERSPE